ncbi:MAG TPA: hypothetical protein VIK95_07195 [Egibacteraceae bacterium]
MLLYVVVWLVARGSSDPYGLPPGSFGFHGTMLVLIARLGLPSVMNSTR